MVKEEQKSGQINLRVKDGDQFYANEVGINFNPGEVILDFKCLTHIHDVGNHRSIYLRHNPIILTPFHAKSFLVMLNKAVKDYEAKFGKVKKPDAMAKAEKLVKKEQKKKSKVKKEEGVGTYFG